MDSWTRPSLVHYSKDSRTLPRLVHYSNSVHCVSHCVPYCASGWATVPTSQYSHCDCTVWRIVTPTTWHRIKISSLRHVPFTTSVYSSNRFKASSLLGLARL